MLSESIPAIYTTIFGKPWESFSFATSDLPFASPIAAGTVAVGYLATLYIGQLVMSARRPFKLAVPFAIHNIILSAFSLLLAVAMIENLVPQLLRRPPHDRPDPQVPGLLYAICHENGYTRKMEFLYYINYLTKVWELVDTLFLVAKKKRLEFLHVYHHTATFLLCYSQLVGRTAVSWVPILLNLLVHVVMYFYYFLSAMHITVWWKKYITVLQIIQFILDLVFVYFCFGFHLISDRVPPLYGMQSCYGHALAAVAGCSILSSYLALFVQFFGRTYSKSSVASTKLINGKVKGTNEKNGSAGTGNGDFGGKRGGRRVRRKLD